MQTGLSYSSIDLKYGSAGVPVWVKCIILVQVALIAKESLPMSGERDWT